jgi:succinoglycan biosynthesis protein ExoM
MSGKHHICVCICTFNRPELLRRLLSSLAEQETSDLFDYSIVVVDNDRTESARRTVESSAHESNISINYYAEPEQNIALARNMAVAHASGDFVAFIDDDETPIDEWLLRMHSALLRYGVDGVLGPVKPLFEVMPPEWTVEAGFFERANYEHETGFILDWRQTGTGNVLIRRPILDEVSGPFRREFGSGGEDLDFFRRAMGLGKVFVWCEEATVYEIIPGERTRLSFQLRRALLRGKASLAHRSGRAFGILKSLAACGVYTTLLPVFLVMGRHVFMKYLIKDFDHIGKLLSVGGINVVKEKYVLK